MTTVHLPSILRDLADGDDHIEITATDIDGVVSELESRYPRLTGRLRTEQGALRPHVKIFLNGETVGLEDTVQESDEVRILPSISGGA